MPDTTQILQHVRNFDHDHPLKILFVCLGNICRSPTAEGAMQHLVNQKNLGAYYEISSAGTAAYHEGEPANGKSRMVAERQGVKLLSRAQRIHADDFDYYDLILAMDAENLENLRKHPAAKNAHDKLHLFRVFDPEVKASEKKPEVPDPYYGGIQGFEEVFEMIMRTADELLKQLEAKRK
jgi:protein-tyrosine phosphatase